MRFFLQVSLLAFLLLFGGVANAQQTVVPLEKLTPVEGELKLLAPGVNVNGIFQTNAYSLPAETTSFNLDNKYDWFICDVAFPDNVVEGKEDYNNPLQYKVLPAGTFVKLSDVKLLEKPKQVRISVKDKMRLTFCYTGMNFNNENFEKLILINPRLIKGNPEPVISSDLANDLVDFIIGLRKLALKQKNQVYADYLQNSLIKMGIYLIDQTNGTTTYYVKE